MQQLGACKLAGLLVNTFHAKDCVPTLVKLRMSLRPKVSSSRRAEPPSDLLVKSGYSRLDLALRGTRTGCFASWAHACGTNALLGK